MAEAKEMFKQLINGELDPILIFSESEEISSLLTQSLQEFGCQLLTAVDREKALIIISEIPLSLIICDENIPDNGGIEILEESLQTQSSATRILLTDRNNLHISVEAINAARVNYFLNKPLNIKKLKRNLTQAVEHHLMAVENKRLNQELMKQHISLSRSHHSLKGDMNLGKRIYEEMLLGSVPKEIPTLEIESISLPSNNLDGDFYDFFRPVEHCLDLVIGDVMGKGIPAALIATALKGHLMRFATPFHRSQSHANGKWYEDLFYPSEIISHLHEAITSQLIRLEYFATLIYGRYNLSQRIFSFVDCGFTKPIHFSEGEITHLKGNSAPLGMSETETYETKSVHYKPGDLFVFYSDGITEAKNPENELFGIERLNELILEHCSLKPKELIQVIRDAVLVFTQSSSLSDDLTLLVVRVTEEAIPKVNIPTTAKFSGDLSQLSAVRDFVQRICNHSAGNQETLSQQMQLAINEIFCNIVEHGLMNDSTSNIVIQAEFVNDGISFDIADQATPYDPQFIEEPSLAGDRSDGFGWYLIKKVIDKVTYTPKKSGHGWNHLTLFKAYKVRKQKMEITHTFINDILVIKPEFSTLDAKEVPEFKETFVDIIENKNIAETKNVILDMSNLDFIDSSGLGSFLSLMRTLRSHGGQLKLANMKKPVFTIFELVSMNKAFEAYNSVDEAVKSFKLGTT